MEQAVNALCDGGISAVRTMPARTMSHITKSVAAVGLESMDMRSKKVTLSVTVLTPWALGAAICEETAIAAGEILAKLGGKCEVGKCGFDGRTGLFSATVMAQFNSEVPKVMIDDTLLTHVLAFTSWRALDDTVTQWSGAKWNFRLEEYFPIGEDQEADPANAFTLIHISESGTENYINATWTYQRRVWDASGVRQIRLGVAEEMATG